MLPAAPCCLQASVVLPTPPRALDGGQEPGLRGQKQSGSEGPRRSTITQTALTQGNPKEASRSPDLGSVASLAAEDRD